MNENKPSIKSDLKRLDAMSDKDIDYSDIPELTNEQLSSMRLTSEALPNPEAKKKRITIYLDNDLLEELHARADAAGHNYQTMINDVLREYLGRSHKQ